MCNGDKYLYSTLYVYLIYKYSSISNEIDSYIYVKFIFLKFIFIKGCSFFTIQYHYWRKKRSPIISKHLFVFLLWNRSLSGNFARFKLNIICLIISCLLLKIQLLLVAINLQNISCRYFFYILIMRIHLKQLHCKYYIVIDINVTLSCTFYNLFTTTLLLTRKVVH